MPSEFSLQHRIQFSETDMAGIVHFSNFFKYMEMCEHAFFRSFGTSIHTGKGIEAIGYPRVHASCEYQKPFSFEDEMLITLYVKDIGQRSLHYLFSFKHLNDDEISAIGELKVVSVSRIDGKLQAVPLPDIVKNNLELYPNSLPELRKKA